MARAKYAAFKTLQEAMNYAEKLNHRKKKKPGDPHAAKVFRVTCPLFPEVCFAVHSQGEVEAVGIVATTFFDAKADPWGASQEEEERLHQLRSDRWERIGEIDSLSPEDLLEYQAWLAEHIKAKGIKVDSKKRRDDKS